MDGYAATIAVSGSQFDPPWNVAGVNAYGLTIGRFEVGIHHGADARLAVAEDRDIEDQEATLGIFTVQALDGRILVRHLRFRASIDERERNHNGQQASESQHVSCPRFP